MCKLSIFVTNAQYWLNRIGCFVYCCYTRRTQQCSLRIESVKLTVAVEAVTMVTSVAAAVKATVCVLTRGQFATVVHVQSTFVNI